MGFLACNLQFDFVCLLRIELVNLLFPGFGIFGCLVLVGCCWMN